MQARTDFGLGRPCHRGVARPRTSLVQIVSSELSAAEFLVTHFFNHQTYHRGQAHALITACGETGDTDLSGASGRSGAKRRVRAFCPA